MEIGIFSRTYETGDLRETYRLMTGHGIFHTQFNLSNAGLPILPEDIREEDIRRIREITEEFGVTIDAVTGTFNMIHPDEEARRSGCRQFAVQCRIAKELGIPVVSLCTGSRDPKNKWKWHDDNLKQSSWDDLMRSTEAILKYAETYHVYLGVETEAGNIINTPARAKKYMESVGSPWIGIIMDGANLFTPRQVPDQRKVLEEAFAILGDDIILAHAKDFYLDKSAAPVTEQEIVFTAAGQGILDFPCYIELLKRSGYEGALVMHGLSRQQVPESREFLEGILNNG